MPVTKTARRALRSSARKTLMNKLTLASLGIAFNKAKKSPTIENIKKAFSIADRAAKKKVIHKNKAARLKSAVSKLVKETKKTKKA